jgi:hypothetical protein
VALNYRNAALRSKPNIELAWNRSLISHELRTEIIFERQLAPPALLNAAGNYSIDISCALVLAALDSPAGPLRIFVPVTSPAQSSSSARANEIAAAASFIFPEASRAIGAPMLHLGTVCRLSKFAAHVFGNPSA